MSTYFTHFPKVDYDIRGTGITESVTNITSYVNIDSKKLDDVSFYSYYIVPDSWRPDNVSYDLYGSDKYYWTFFVVNPHLKNYYYDWPQKQSRLLDHTKGIYEGLGAVGDQDVWGKFSINEVVEGSISGATGTVIGIYPTMEWVQILPTPDQSTQFQESGEGILGSDNQGFFTATSIKSAALAPHHFIDNSTEDITPKRTAGVTPVSNYEVEVENNLSKSKIRVIKPEKIREISKEWIQEIKNGN